MFRAMNKLYKKAKKKQRDPFVDKWIEHGLLDVMMKFGLYKWPRYQPSGKSARRSGCKR